MTDSNNKLQEMLSKNAVKATKTEEVKKEGSVKLEYCSPCFPPLQFSCDGEYIKADMRGVYTPKNEKEKAMLDLMVERYHVILKEVPPL